MPVILPNSLLTFKEAQDYLRVCRSTLYRLMEKEKLAGYKVGNSWRFYLDDVRACVQTAPLRQVDENQGDL
jgi:excisionase family DNA binding protein